MAADNYLSFEGDQSLFNLIVNCDKPLTSTQQLIIKVPVILLYADSILSDQPPHHQTTLNF